jgi:hypothetical protein
MEYLDAHHKDEILAQLLEGEWQLLLPKHIYSNLSQWFQRQLKTKELAVRFVCQAPKDQKFAVYFLCSPKIANGKVKINDLKFGEDGHLLAVPPQVYELPLYCMPEDLYSKILGKKRKGNE